MQNSSGPLHSIFNHPNSTFILLVDDFRARALDITSETFLKQYTSISKSFGAFNPIPNHPFSTFRLFATCGQIPHPLTTQLVFARVFPPEKVLYSLATHFEHSRTIRAHF
jgi:hypothetical protein